jgi:hypothetical protein
MPDSVRRGWSLDAAVIVRPAWTFRTLAAERAEGGIWIAWRRPLFVTAVLSTFVSLIAASSLTLRLVLSAFASWSFIPLLEVLALIALTLWRRDRSGLAGWIDNFFVGHAPWTALLITIAAVLSFVPHSLAWWLITGPFVWAAALVVVWSLYLDHCFFRFVLGARPWAAARHVALIRLLTWPLALWVIMGQSRNPWFAAAELARDAAEVWKR